jgi:hypothetical protein
VKNKHDRILIPEIRNGYYSVGLYKDHKRVHKRIHRLIAEAFIRNPDNLPMINHKDQNRLNNDISNLEWCDNTYNSQYPNDLSVYCFDLDKVFSSASEASVHTGVCRTSILKCCRGQLQQAGGMLWCYSKDKSKKFPS